MHDIIRARSANDGNDDRMTNQFEYHEVGTDQLDNLRPLWERLNSHHAQLSRHFFAPRMKRTFEQRRQQFLNHAKEGKLRIELVYHADQQIPIAYCITNVSSEGIGEIDSLFVEEKFRDHGIGTELMRHALEWLNRESTTANTIVVLHENDRVLAFYERFGFHPDTIHLRQKT
jgi:diamine N-acetyltransferase